MNKTHNFVSRKLASQSSLAWFPDMYTLLTSVVVENRNGIFQSLL